MDNLRRFSKAELDAIAALYADLGRTLETSLAMMLRTEVMVNYRGVEQQKFQDFFERNSFVMAVEPISDENRESGENTEDGEGGNWPAIYINFSETIVSPVLDRLLGAEIADGARRFESRVEMTPLEKKLFGRVMDAVCRAMEDAWRPLFSVRFHGTHLEEVGFHEPFVMLKYSFSLFHISGMMAIALPAACVDRLLERQEKRAPSKPRKLRRRKRTESHVEIPDPALEIVDSLRASLVDISVQMRGGTVAPRELLDWHIGDVIHLNRSEETEFSVLVEGTEKFIAAAGKFRKRKVFRIL